MARQVSATQASRRFSEMLDDIELTGEEYVIERRGRPVARVTSAGPRRITIGELLEVLRSGPQPDPGFLDDLRRIRDEQGPADLEDPWERYSTPPS